MSGSDKTVSCHSTEKLDQSRIFQKANGFWNCNLRIKGQNCYYHA